MNYNRSKNVRHQAEKKLLTRLIRKDPSLANNAAVAAAIANRTKARLLINCAICDPSVPSSAHVHKVYMSHKYVGFHCEEHTQKFHGEYVAELDCCCNVRDSVDDI